MKELEINLFSPRWGHEDTYNITIDKNKIEINMSQRIAKYEYIENKFKNISKESIESIMQNDNIPIPDNFIYLFFELISSIIYNEISEENSKKELLELEKWVNCMTKSCQFPTSDYWRSKA